MNIYTNPEKFGLELFGEVDYSSGSYEFDLLAVWRDKHGTSLWYYAEDSGCSCPVPFEGKGIPDLTGPVTRHEIAVQIQKRLTESSRGYWTGPDDEETPYGRDAAAHLIERLMTYRSGGVEA